MADSLEAMQCVGVGAKDGNKYYKMEDKFNVDNVRKFAQAMKSIALQTAPPEEWGPWHGGEAAADAPQPAQAVAGGEHPSGAAPSDRHQRPRRYPPPRLRLR